MDVNEKKENVEKILNYIRGYIFKGLEAGVTGDLSALELVVTTSNVLYEKAIMREYERMASIGLEVTKETKDAELDAIKSGIVLPFKKKPSGGDFIN